MSPPTVVVRAQVVDVRGDDPKPTDRFWVDTQVWKVLTYSRAPCPQHLREYPKYVKRSRQAGAILATGTIQVAELAKCIEYSEKELYEHATGQASVPIKHFRRDAAARPIAVGEIKSSWSILTSLGRLTTAPVIDQDLVDAATRMSTGELLDAGDAIQLTEARRCGLSSVLSDDSDFASVPDIVLFTANERVLMAANSANKMLRR